MPEQHHVDAKFTATATLSAELAEAAAAAEANPDAPLTEHTKVTRGHGRAKVLQVRLNPEELAELERVADARGLPPSTVAREAILTMLNPAAARTVQQQRLVEEFSRFVAASVTSLVADVGRPSGTS